MMMKKTTCGFNRCLPGNHLSEAAEEAFRAEEILEGSGEFSFDPQLGYLTSCPTNTGTGLRASLMLHLPMLTRFKQMGNVNQSVAKLGLTMRGIYGEGSEALGDLYQVSNQITLGRREEDIIDAVTAVGKQLIDMESKLRERCRTQQKAEVEDTLWRSYGALRYAVLMNEKEFMQHWSNLASWQRHGHSACAAFCFRRSFVHRAGRTRKAIRAAEPARTPRGAGALSAAAGEAETV